jgi:N-acetyl-S-(2-succino)cysteine monooxygenase
VFLADNVCVRDAKMEALCRSAQYIANFEPFTLLSALAPLTSHIGLVATATTSYNEPFHVARKFASPDHLGLERPTSRYARAATSAASNYALPVA